jgi:hypothetical protein
MVQLRECGGAVGIGDGRDWFVGCGVGAQICGVTCMQGGAIAVWHGMASVGICGRHVSCTRIGCSGNGWPLVMRVRAAGSSGMVRGVGIGSTPCGPCVRAAMAGMGIRCQCRLVRRVPYISRSATCRMRIRRRMLDVSGVISGCRRRCMTCMWIGLSCPVCGVRVVVGRINRHGVCGVGGMACMRVARTPATAIAGRVPRVVAGR